MTRVTSAPASASASTPLRWRHAAYGLLGLPLAMAALPIYIQAPAYYTLLRGVGLAQLGWVLFAARLVDTVQDPLLGHAIDRRRGSIGRWLLPATLVLALAFAGLWLPPPGGVPALLWLAVMLVCVYSAHSAVNIAYLAWGARLQGTAALLPAAAWREGAGLAGLLMASAIPSAIMAGDTERMTARMGAYSLAFAALLLVALLALLRLAPPWPRHAASGASWRDALRSMAANRAFRRLLLPYFLNALAVSLPATLALFFISDRLHAAPLAGVFLGCYFSAAACCLPAWTALAARRGPLPCWRLGMALATAGFAGAAMLGAGDVVPYCAVCIAAGAALGADLALPPVIAAQLIGHDEAPGVYYGVLTLLGKLALALSGLALSALAALGYRPGAAGGALLPVAYAIVPCLLKLAAMAVLRRDLVAPPSPSFAGSV